MMHDATIEVTCDNASCRECVRVAPEWVYTNSLGNNGHYDVRDSEIEDKLEREHGWVVKGDKQYCCEECAP